MTMYFLAWIWFDGLVCLGFSFPDFWEWVEILNKQVYYLHCLIIYYTIVPSPPPKKNKKDILDHPDGMRNKASNQLLKFTQKAALIKL